MEFDATLWLIGAALPPLIITWIATWLARSLAPRWGLIDRPAARKVHLVPTPLGGGVAIWFGVIATFGMASLAVWFVASRPDWQEQLPEFARPHLAGVVSRLGSLWVLLGCATALSALGLVDDRWGLDWRLRLSVQFAAAALVLAWQGMQLTAFIPWPVVTWGLSAVWIVGLINSFYMLDNMDALSSGVAALAAAMLTAVMLLAPDPETQTPQLFVAGYLLVLLGALLGFLFHNRPPAKIFMGDAGSYFIGFYLATATLLATYTGYHSTRPHAILAPLFIMAVPLYDMTTVLWIRVREGRSPFQADKCHFSHRLVELGFTKGQAVLTVYLTTATCGLGALLLHRVDVVGAILITLLVFCVLALIAMLESTARRKLNT